MSTKAVLFDFYGTLAEAVDWGPTLGEVLESHGYPAGDGVGVPDDWWGLLDGIEHSAESASRDAYVAWELARLCRLADACGVPADRCDTVVADLHRATKRYELALHADVAETLERLRARGFALGVCSNWDWDLPELTGRLGLGDLFDVVVTSARAGARKPHPRIYEHTLDGLGISAAEALFVGDSLGPDVTGPVAHGMRATHLVRGDGSVAAEPPPGVTRIANLLKVVDLV